MQINQTATPYGTDLFTSFILITHERGELPFSAYDRHIQTSLTPGSDVSVYFSKSITARLNTARNPCHVSPDLSLWQKEVESTAPNQVRAAVDDNKPNSIITNDESDSGSSDTRGQTWEFDFLDQLRMNRSMNEQQSVPPQMTALKGSTVRLFGTTFFYSRESCGWAECSRKVRQVCNCSSVVELWSYKMHGCEAVEACERAECQVKQISYKTCPLACVVAKFVKHNTITETGSEANLAPGTIQVKLVRSEAVQVATEEEIFSLAKLFSEVGGLCSLFIGFSCIFLFELVEAVILMYKDGNSTQKVTKQIGTLLPNCDIHTRTALQQFQAVTATGVVENPNVEHFADSESFFEQNGTTVGSRAEHTTTEDTRSESNCGHGQADQTANDMGQLIPTKNDSEPYCQNQPVWEGEILVLPVCFVPGGLLTSCYKTSLETDNPMNVQVDRSAGIDDAGAQGKNQISSVDTANVHFVFLPNEQMVQYQAA